MKINKRTVLMAISGGILLPASFIIITNSQASNISSNTNGGIMLSDNGKDVQSSPQDTSNSAFKNSFQRTQQEHGQTGHWGTADFYVNGHGTMHVGSGRLHGTYTNLVDMSKIKAISFDDNVQAPSNSHDLFTTTGLESNPSLRAIYHLGNVDTNQTTDMSDMFFNDSSLHDLDVSHWNTSNVTNMYEMFNNDGSLHNLNVSHFNTHNVNDMAEMFNYDSSLHDLDLSSFDTSSVANMSAMFGDANIYQLKLGPSVRLNNTTGLSDIYEQGNQTLNLDGNIHPGTWTR